MRLDNVVVAVIGLGYVGLPLAVSFAKKYEVIAYDIDENRVNELLAGFDRTREIQDPNLLNQNNLHITHDENILRGANVYIITVPTPIDEFKKPDLIPLISASQIAGLNLEKGNYVIYESTVYPGATEEVCSAILSEKSGLELNQDFYIGYSPERINPGDNTHTFENIIKITSGSTPNAAHFIDALYSSVISAETYLAPSIKVAEAAKVIENIQRDINIAFVNELSMLFDKLKIDTLEVLSAAATKWNFLHFKPGLVGGHCIGVDPYYLAHKAREVGFHAEMIESGRRINDQYPKFIVEKLVREILIGKVNPLNCRILLLGYTFKENCPDIRNTKVRDILEELQALHFDVDIVDPYATDIGNNLVGNVEIQKEIPNNNYEVIIGAVAHETFVSAADYILTNHAAENCIVVDVKNMFPNCPNNLKHVKY